MGKNPGTVNEVFHVDLERPRNRKSKEFVEIEEKVISKLDSWD